MLVGTQLTYRGRCFIPPAVLFTACFFSCFLLTTAVRADGRVDALRRRASGTLRRDRIERAMEKAAAFIRSQQNDDGSFGSSGDAPRYFHEGRPKPPDRSEKWKNPAVKKRLMGTVRMNFETKRAQVMQTALAALALMKTGADIEDEAVTKALDYLKTHDTWNTGGIGARCAAWLEAERLGRRPKEFWKYLNHDGIRLAFSPAAGGGWKDTIWDNGGHTYWTAFAVLGVRDYQRAGGKMMPPDFWEGMVQYWQNSQLADGGWGDHGGANAPRSDYTAAALASLYTALDAANPREMFDYGADKAPAYLSGLPAVLDRGQAWLAEHFVKTLATNKPGISSGHRWCFYLWWACRAGLLSGNRRFGKDDWYREGVVRLFGLQTEDGSFCDRDSLRQTAFGLLFLAAGGRGVLFARLDWGEEPAKRCRDIAHATGWLNAEGGWRCSWKVARLADHPFTWLDAPILYITGRSKPAFTDRQVRKLRTYAYQGGMIFSAAAAGSTDFSQEMRAVYRRAFPRQEMAPVPPGDPVYLIPNRLGGTPRLHRITNGARPLVFHTDEDISKIWQMNLMPAARSSFMFAANLAAAAAGGSDGLRPYPSGHWPRRPDEERLKTVAVVRVKHGGNYNPEPLAWLSLSRRLAADEGIRLVQRFLAAEKLPGAGAKIAAMTGTGELVLTAAEKEAIKTFIANGGMLLVDSAGGGEAFYASARKALAGMFGTNAVKPLGADAPILARAYNPVKGVSYTPPARKRLNIQDDAGSSGKIRLEAIDTGGPGGVLLSREDLTCGLLGFPSGTVDGYASRSAVDIVKNVVVLASGVDADASAVRYIQNPPRALKNIAGEAEATSPDGHDPDGGGKEAPAAIDGDYQTYWDERDGKKSYVIKLKFPGTRTVFAVGVTGYKHHENAPKDFRIVLDGSVKLPVTNAVYRENRLHLAFAGRECTTLELRITGYYHRSPGIRELMVYGTDH